jgi:hypothetical protein
MRRKRLEDSVYKRHVEIVVCSDAEFNDLTEELYDDKAGVDSNDFASFYSTPTGRTTHYYIWLSTFRNTPRDIAHLCHEVLHLTFEVMRYVGLKHTVASEEAYTYYFDSMLKQALQFLRRK